MMLDVDFAQLRQGFIQYLPIGAFRGAILLIELVLVLVSWTIGPDVQRTLATPIPPIASTINAEALGLGHYLTVAAILFTIGIFGIFLNRKNVIIILMSIELIMLAVNVNLVAFSAFLGDLVGQIYALLVLTVAAAEAAIGLAILVAYYRNRGSIAVEDINLMKG